MNSISKSALESDSVISTQFIQSGAFTWLNGPKEINAAPAIDIYSSSNLHVYNARASRGEPRKKESRALSIRMHILCGGERGSRGRGCRLAPTCPA
jgi:hypothetical protein